jgi:hypothetical protein
LKVPVAIVKVHRATIGQPKIATAAILIAGWASRFPSIGHGENLEAAAI